MAVQFIEIGGEKMAVLPAADYARLVEDAEDRADLRMAMEAETRRDGGEEYLPAEMVDRLLAGEAPLRIWRKHRGMTLETLSRKAGISIQYLSEIERGIRMGTMKVWRALAEALGLDVDDIMPRVAG